MTTMQKLYFVNLSKEEWRLVIGAVAAYQHRADYRDVHQKLSKQYEHLLKLKHCPSETMKAS